MTHSDRGLVSRRRFLASGALTLTGLGVQAAQVAEEAPRPGRTPDGSQAKDMITPAAQRCIERGLDYLSRSQHADGSFGQGQQRGNVAITSLAALALMSGGHQPGRGPYGKVVQDALQAVLAREDPQNPGYFRNPQSSNHGPMYEHGFGTLFLAEVHGMVSSKDLRTRLREKLRAAVDLIVRSQNREGGWRYSPTPKEADISVTICQVMALRAARNAGVFVPKGTVDRCTDYVKACQDHTGGFRYVKQGSPTGFARTAAGVVALYSAGIYQGPEIESGLRYLQQQKPQEGFARQRLHDMHYFYGHYYAAQAMWTAGGTYWSEWYPAIREELINRATANRDGVWTDSVCPHYATAMACIILQIPNNYLPILQKRRGRRVMLVNRGGPVCWSLVFMTVQTFRQLLTQRPFKPFRLIMSSGEAYEVRHPEMAWLTRTDILVGLDQTEEGVPAEFRICSLLHVATVEPLTPAVSGQ